MDKKINMNTRLNMSASRTKHNIIIGASDKFKTNIIYQIDFSNGEVYIGCTTRKLSVRISEHYNFAFNKKAKQNVYKSLRKHKGAANIKVLEHLTSDKFLHTIETHHIAIAKMKYGNKLLNTYKV